MTNYFVRKLWSERVVGRVGRKWVERVETSDATLRQINKSCREWVKAGELMRQIALDSNNFNEGV